MIRKRLLSACLALALCLSLLPATALAADNDTVYVGGVALSGSTDSPAYATTDDNGTVTKVDASANKYNIKWDGSTLTLRNATIKESVSTDTSTFIAGAAIGVLNQNGDANLTITLEGTNTIAEVSMGIYVLASSKSTGSASLTITGDGILSASSGSNPGIRVQSNTGNGTLTITGAKVTASSSSSNGDYGVQIRCGDGSDASLTVNDGSLTATGSGVTFTGIKMQFGSSDSSTGTPTVTVSNNAIVRANGGIANNSSSPIQYETGSDSTGGIVFDGDEGTVYGSVELQDNLTIDEGESLNIGQGASLTIPDDITLTNEGAVTTTGDGTLTNNGTINNSGILPDNINGNGTVNHAPTITTDSLPNGTEGTSYSQTLTATGTTPITWSVTSGSLPDGLTLDRSTGLISGTPTVDGTFNFTVKATNTGGSDSKSLSITIGAQTNVPVTGVSLNTSTLNLIEGGTGTLIATVEPSNATNKNVTWESSTKSVATVDANGLVTAVSAGTATITVTTEDGNKTASCTVTVTVPVTGVTLSQTQASLYYNRTPSTLTLTATVTPDNATNKDVTWTSSNPSAATVNQNGVVTAVAPGTAVITVTTVDGGFTATCTVTVSRYSTGGGSTTYAVTAPDAENGTVRVSPSRASRGTTVTITVTPDEGYELESLTVLDSRDNEITLTDKGDGKYTFTMPSGRVTVEASFAEIAPEPLPFGDVDDGDWFAGAVRFVYESGMMNGVSETSFAPHATTSRSMIVTILYRLEGEPVVDYATDFTDVAGDAYYAEAVRWAASEGIVGGYGGGLFGADDAVTREQLAAILYRYAVYKGYDVSVGEDTNILSYADFADLSEYAIPAMQWACGAGIVNGTSESTLAPQGAATRAQVAAMLMRFCEATG